MATMQFEERFDVTKVTSKLFKKLWRDNNDSHKYYITIDFNFIDRFYAENDEEAVEKFEKKI